MRHDATDLEAKTPQDHPDRALVSLATARAVRLHQALSELMGTDGDSPGAAPSGPPTVGAIAITILKAPVRARVRRACALLPC